MARALFDDGYTMLLQQHTITLRSLQVVCVCLLKIKAYADKVPYTVAPRELSYDFSILS